MSNNHVFIFGAGFTKSVFDQAPLNNQLINTLLELNPSSRLKGISEKYNSADIESVLTKLDIDIQQGKYDPGIRKEINAEIAEYFQRFRFNNGILKDKNWLEKFAMKIFKQDDVIINLNYDCFLDGLLDYFEVWNPKNGYGAIDNILVEDDQVNKNNIQILKIHGSENFSYQPYQDRPDSVYLSYEFNESVFPKSAKNTFYGRRSIIRGVSGPTDVAKPYIIAPSYVKIPAIEISYLMIDAIKAATESNKMIIVGCSLRSEDSFLWLLLARFLRDPDWRERKFVIVDPFAIDIANRMRLYWGVNIEGSLGVISKKLEDSLDDLLDEING